MTICPCLLRTVVVYASHLGQVISTGSSESQKWSVLNEKLHGHTIYFSLTLPIHHRRLRLIGWSLSGTLPFHIVEGKESSKCLKLAMKCSRLEASSRCLMSPHNSLARVTHSSTSMQGAKKSNYLVNSTHDFQILTLSYCVLVFLFVNLSYSFFSNVLLCGSLDED